MTTELVLTYLLVDDTHEQDKVFNSVTELAVWLHGRRETDFVWLTLHGDTTIDGWSAIFNFIHKSIQFNPTKTACIALRAFELNLPHIDSSTFDEPDLRAMSRIPTIIEGELVLDELLTPKPVPFSELPDGALFYYAETYAYGSRIKLQKTLEDGGEHNAVHVVNTNIGVNVPDDRMVIPA